MQAAGGKNRQRPAKREGEGGTDAAQSLRLGQRQMLRCDGKENAPAVQRPEREQVARRQQQADQRRPGEQPRQQQADKQAGGRPGGRAARLRAIGHGPRLQDAAQRCNEQRCNGDAQQAQRRKMPRLVAGDAQQKWPKQPAGIQAQPAAAQGDGGWRDAKAQAR